MSKSGAPSGATAPATARHPDRAALARVGEAVRQRLAGDPQAWRVPVEQAEIFAVGGFLLADECARLCAMIDAVAQPSKVFHVPGYPDHRTSYSGDLDPDDGFVQLVERRLSDLLGIDPAWGERMQGQRYQPGQQFKPHCDWFDTAADYWPSERARGGQRSWTAMAYLNDVEGGGITEFPHLGVTIPPQTGALLVWNNALADGRANPQVLHAALPVERGVKYVVTKWFRTRTWS